MTEVAVAGSKVCGDEEDAVRFTQAAKARHRVSMSRGEGCAEYSRIPENVEDKFGLKNRPPLKNGRGYQNQIGATKTAPPKERSGLPELANLHAFFSWRFSPTSV
jgi:hypothetical protein